MGGPPDQDVTTLHHQGGTVEQVIANDDGTFTVTVVKGGRGRDPSTVPDAAHSGHIKKPKP